MRSFRYDFTATEMAYLLFARKTCPLCGGRMSKEKCCETVDGSVFNTNSVPLYISGRKVRHYFYRFTCRKCDSEYTLTELAERQRDARKRKKEKD